MRRDVGKEEEEVKQEMFIWFPAYINKNYNISRCLARPFFFFSQPLQLLTNRICHVLAPLINGWNKLFQQIWLKMSRPHFLARIYIYKKKEKKRTGQTIERKLKACFFLFVWIFWYFFFCFVFFVFVKCFFFFFHLVRKSWAQGGKLGSDVSSSLCTKEKEN